jgi:hypothetical protein
MATQKQRAAARKNIKKAARAAKRKTNFETFAKEDTPSARAAGSESQKITTVKYCWHGRSSEKFVGRPSRAVEQADANRVT